MNFEWDPEKDRKNMEIHGVSFSVAKYVFNDIECWERYDASHSKDEDRWQTIGLVEKILFVVYTKRGETIRLISARIADKKERGLYNGERNITSWTKTNKRTN